MHPGRVLFAGMVALAAAAVITVRAQGPVLQCSDGSPRPGTGWCAGDIFAGIGGPIIYDGNGVTIPAWDSTGEPVPRLDQNGQPIVQNPPPDRAPNAIVSSRLMVDPAYAGPVCQFLDGTREAATLNSSALFGYSCRPEQYWGLMFEPVCADVTTHADIPGGSFDTDSNPLCPANSEPQYTVALPHAPNGGIFLLADDHGNFPPGNAGPLRGVVNPEQGFTYGCAVDPASGHLWTTDFYANKVNEFVGTGTSPQTSIDLSALTLGTTCGQDNIDTIGGCGGVGPILFVNQGEGGATTDLFVGTTIGTNKIFRYSMAGIGPTSVPDEFQVPIGAMGLDLAADRETMFYTSGDPYIRVFNITKVNGVPQPVGATALGARMIAAGMELVGADDQPTANPNALYGRIPYAGRGVNTPLGGGNLYQIRLLPPGDPLKFDVDPATGESTLIKTGILIAQYGDNDDVNLIDLTPADTAHGFTQLTAQNRYGYARDLRAPDFLPGLTSFRSFDVTPDGRSFWTAALLNGTTPQIIKFHIPTRTLEVVKDAPAGTSIINSLCIAKGYAAGATQPNCSTDPNNLLCKPLPEVCSIDSLDPDCTSPGEPGIQSKTPDLMNFEGDVVHVQAVVATDPGGGALAYAQTGLPPGLHIDPGTGFVSGQIDANGGGSYHVMVTVTNAIGSSSASFNWAVAEWNVPPRLEVSVFAPSVPRGVPLSIQLSGQDGDACDDVFFVLKDGQLPPGLTIQTPAQWPANADDACLHHVSSGPFTTTIAGTPTMTGSFTFTIMAKDNHEDDTRQSGTVVRGIDPIQLQTLTIVVTGLPPDLSLVPTNLIIEATGPDGAIVALDGSLAFDPDPGDTLEPFTWTAASGTPPTAPGATANMTLPIGTNVVRLDVRDNTGLTSSMDVTVLVRDTTPPTIANMPATQTLEATAPGGAVATFSLPTASDLVDAAPTVGCSPASGATFPLGVTTVTCTAADHASPMPNSATRSFTVTVTDLTKPTIDSHANLAVEATGPAGAAVNYTRPATHDIVDGTGTAVCAPVPGATFPFGTTTVTCSATDAHGNSATNTTFLVNVADTRPPTLTNVPANLTAFTSSSAGVVVSYANPTATDLVDGPVNVVCSPASGALFPVGTTIVTCAATDSHQNAAQAMFTVTVNNQPPVCTVAQPSIAALWPPNHKFVPVSILNVTDPNMKPLAIAVTGILQDEPTNGLGDGDTPIDAVINGSNVQLRAERSGKGDGRVYVISFTATNTTGGSCSGTVRVVVPHDRRKNGSAVDSLVRYDSLLAGGPPLGGPEFNLPPALTNPGSQTSTAGKSATLALKATDPNLDPLTYGASNLPAGLSLNASTGVISGTPTTASAPTVTVSVADGIAPPVSASFKWTIVIDKDKDKDKDKTPKKK